MENCGMNNLTIFSNIYAVARAGKCKVYVKT